MRDKRRRGDLLRPLRRGIGLGLALVALWGISLTADLSGAWAALQRWASDSQAVVALVAGELGQPPEDTVLAGLDPWGQLLVEHVYTYTVPVSVFITVGGGIYFLYLLLTRRRV